MIIKLIVTTEKGTNKLINLKTDCAILNNSYKYYIEYK